MKYQIIKGNIIETDVEVIVNSWNRNIIPWWLLIPQGVSGAIKKHAGLKPFIEVAKFGAIPLGEARFTSAGKLPYKGIIHVAGINMFWVGTEKSVINSVKNAVALAEKLDIQSIAIPLIGSGSGNRGKQWSLRLIDKALNSIESNVDVTVVTYDLNDEA